jgi:hypothetical protein
VRIRISSLHIGHSLTMLIRSIGPTAVRLHPRPLP